MVEPESTDQAKTGISKAATGIGKIARETTIQVAAQASGLMESTRGLASDAVEKLTTKKPDPYEAAITEYNSHFTTMNDWGLTLLRQRERSVDLIQHIELLVNSIANTPKSFATDFEEIEVHRAKFVEEEEFARKKLEAARASAMGAGAGFAAGAAVASLAPTAAMWVATTVGTASTGTAISTLSGAAASQAALAWLGGGALAAGGGGTAAGSALLALAGPIGWTVAGATLLTSIVLFKRKKSQNLREKQNELLKIKNNTAEVRTLGTQINDLLQRTTNLRGSLTKSFSEALPFFGADFLALTSEQQSQLATLVNNTKACAALLNHRIEQAVEHE